MNEQIDAARESRLRSALTRAGYALRKSRAWKHVPNLDNLGGFMIVDRMRNWCVRGQRFELDLDDVEAFVEEFRS